MTWQIGSITLPVDPMTVTNQVTKVTKKAPIYDHYPYLFPLGSDIDQVVIKGWIVERGKNKSQLRASYVDPLKAYAKSISTVTVTAPGHSGTYLVQKAKFEEPKGTLNAFFYTITLWWYEEL